MPKEEKEIVLNIFVFGTMVRGSLMWKQWFKGVRALKLDEPEVTSWHQHLVVGRDQAIS